MKGHAHAWPGVYTDCVDVDPKACLKPLARDGRVIAYLFAHEDGSPRRCTGYVPLEAGDGRETWEAEGSLADGTLTLKPSIECTADGFHGHVVKGAWVPA